MTLDRGTVVLVELDPTMGDKQRGVRPCIAVNDPSVNADQRLPLIAVAPVVGLWIRCLLERPPGTFHPKGGLRGTMVRYNGLFDGLIDRPVAFQQ